MPYIKQADKEKFADFRHALCHVDIKDAGELNYALTLVAKHFLTIKGQKYQVMNDVVGALDGAKAEFQRRVVAPYEDTKIQQNGDVY